MLHPRRVIRENLNGLVVFLLLLVGIGRRSAGNDALGRVDVTTIALDGSNLPVEDDGELLEGTALGLLEEQDDREQLDGDPSDVDQNRARLTARDETARPLARIWYGMISVG